MLECACVILHIVVVIVRIGEEILIAGIDECARKIRCRKPELFGIVHLINLPRIVVEILPYLVTKVGVGVAVADNRIVPWSVVTTTLNPISERRRKMSSDDE